MLSQQTPTNDTPRATALATTPAPQRNAPNLIVIGAMKASTTTFYELITHHPDIWFSNEKEPHYFTSPAYGEPRAWQKYLRLFDDAPASAKFLGEASTGYSKLPHFGNTPLRLREMLDDPRFIYLIRDPVERTISNYQHAYLAGHYPIGTKLAEAIETDPILIDASCYARQIRAYREVFGGEALLIIPTNQLHIEPTLVMCQVECFLNLRAYNSWEASLKQSNSKQALSRSLKLQSLLPSSVLSTLRKLLPAQVRGWLKQLAVGAPALPPVSHADRQLVFERIAEDLRDLTQLADENLTAWISDWPSVQQLGEE